MYLCIKCGVISSVPSYLHVCETPNVYNMHRLVSPVNREMVLSNAETAHEYLGMCHVCHKVVLNGDWLLHAKCIKRFCVGIESSCQCSYCWEYTNHTEDGYCMACMEQVNYDSSILDMLVEERQKEDEFFNPGSDPNDWAYEEDNNDEVKEEMEMMPALDKIEGFDPFAD